MRTRTMMIRNSKKKGRRGRRRRGQETREKIKLIYS
jgi:hypothetical protein